jgi:pSer/pThr/pTyr-binding forkhead associated (FHA) protein
MEIRLVVEQGRSCRVLPLPQRVVTLGRSRRCTVRLAAARVSRSHCRLYRVKPGFVVAEDLQSTNGTRLNGDRLNGLQVVRPGDRLKVGPFAFVVEYELTPAALEALRKFDRAAQRLRKQVRLDGAGPLPPPPQEKPERERRTRHSTEVEP